MAAAQKRLLTAENSRLGKVPDLAAMLQKENAWSTLPRETREHLYTLLPPAVAGEPERDPDVNPLLIARLEPHIKEALLRFQNDLKEGRETRRWRVQAMQVCLNILRLVVEIAYRHLLQAGQDHVDGKFDEWKMKMREEYWGKPSGEEAAETEAKELSESEGGVKLNGHSEMKKEAGEEADGKVAKTEERGGREGTVEMNGQSEMKYGSRDVQEVTDSEASESEL